MQYPILAKFTQNVSKEVELLVTADSVEEAHQKAHEAMSEYPSPVTTEGILRACTVKETHWPPAEVHTKLEE